MKADIMADTAYNSVQLFIDGNWCDAVAGGTLAVLDPATEDMIGTVAHAGTADLDLALAAAERGFAAWKALPPFERCAIMRAAASLLRSRVDGISLGMTLEQGKPRDQARAETLAGAEIIEWFAEEGKRSYGKIVAARLPGVRQFVERTPIGPVAAFTPWNFPINQAVRKVSGALAAGCSVVLKGPEETPFACSELVRAFADAGVPAGALNLVYGNPAEISDYLIAHPTIRKISFTGSTAVGKQLAMLAGKHMKRATMELGGHAPAIVCKDADLDVAVRTLAGNKYRNAGQVCVAPTRMIVQRDIYEPFVEQFVAWARGMRVGSGLDPDVTMGPLAHGRRVEAMEALVLDALRRGATLRTGGSRIGNKGYFFEPTVLTGVPTDAAIMQEEPFGPIAIVNPFDTVEEALAEANRLSYGLAAYLYAKSPGLIERIEPAIQSGMVGVNHHGLGAPELPFGGMGDSGYGTEGGSEALEAFQNLRLVTHAAA